MTTFAMLQHLYLSRRIGFEGTVLTMNSRYSTLAEGIANNAALMAYGVTEMEDLPAVNGYRGLVDVATIHQVLG